METAGSAGRRRPAKKLLLQIPGISGESGREQEACNDGVLPFARQSPVLRAAGRGYKCQYVGTPARTGLLQSQRRPPAEPAALATALAYFLDKAGRHGRQYGPPHWALSYSSGDFVTELRHLLLYTDYNERGFLCCEEKRSSIRKSALHAAAVSGFVREMP